MSSSEEPKPEERAEIDGGHGSTCNNASCVPFCATTLISCREYSRLSSKRLDEPLSFFEAFCYWFHHVICMVCRRFDRQLRTIHRAGQALAEESLQSGNNPAHQLTPEAQERIRKHLHENR